MLNRRNNQGVIVKLATRQDHNPASQVFISYSREDVAFARDLRERIIAFGHNPWMDVFNIPAGARWPDEIDQALRNADVVVGLMSPHSLASEHVKNEWDWAIANERRLVLLMIDSCEIPFYYVSRSYIDFTGDPGEAFAALSQALESNSVAKVQSPEISTDRYETSTAVTVPEMTSLSLRPAPILVGRDQELSELRVHLLAAIRGEGSLVLMSGEAGIGKTSLSASIAIEATNHDVLVLVGSCYDLITTPPYGPWTEITWTYPERADLPPLPDVFQQGKPLGEIDSQAEFFDAVGRFFVSVANCRPLLLILEDIHWADQASLELLRYLSRVLADHRVLLLATLRDDEITRDHLLFALLPALVRESRVHRLNLHRLVDEAVHALVAQQYALTNVDATRLVAYLHRLAEGNPFFTSELLLTLEDEGMLCQVNDNWHLVEFESLHLPPLVEQTISRRLDRMSTETNRLLEAAAIIGPEIPLDTWQSISGASDESLIGVVAEAVETYVLHEMPTGNGYRFSHALVRQTLYERVTLPRRRLVHREIAELLGDQSRSEPSTVAYHFQQANDPRAIEWFVRAGERALSLFALQSAIDQLNQAHELGESLSVIYPSRGYHLRGKAHEMIGDYEMALTDFETFLNLARQNDESRSEWQALLDIGILWASRDYEKTGDYYARALDVARQIADPTMLAKTLNQIGNWLANIERQIESEQHHLEALAIFQELNDKSGIAATYDLLGTSALLGCNMVKANQYYDEATPLLRELDDRPRLAQALGNRGLASLGALPYSMFIDPDRRASGIAAREEARAIALETDWKAIEVYTICMSTQTLIVHGNYQEALDGSLHGLKIAEEIAHGQWICFTRQNLSDIYRDLFLLDEARECLEPALAIADYIGSIVWHSWIRCSLALSHIEKSELDRAESLINVLQGIERREVSFASMYEPFTRAVLARAAGDPERALEIIDHVIAIDPAGRGDEVPKSLNLRGDLLIDLGHFDEAEDTLRRSCDLALALGYRPLHWRALASLHRLYLAQGRPVEAGDAGDAARDIIEELAGALKDPEMRDHFVTHALATMTGGVPYVSRSSYGGLTEREYEILRLVSDGLTNAQVGERLYISSRTVSSHLSSIYGKFNVTNRAAAIRVASERGLI